MNVQECAVFNTFFVPTKEFKEYLVQHDIDCGQLVKDEVSFDPEIIKYVKDNSDWHSYGRAKSAIRGMKTGLMKIGFFGTVSIIDVDIDRKWMIEYDSCDVPYPVYLDIAISAKNYVRITKEF